MELSVVKYEVMRCIHQMVAILTGRVASRYCQHKHKHAVCTETKFWRLIAQHVPTVRVSTYPLP